VKMYRVVEKLALYIDPFEGVVSDDLLTIVTLVLQSRERATG